MSRQAEAGHQTRQSLEELMDNMDILQLEFDKLLKKMGGQREAIKQALKLEKELMSKKDVHEQKFLEEQRRRLQAENQAREATKELKTMKDKLEQSCISIADNVGIAEVDVTVGPVHTDLGNGATLIRKGGGMTVANGAQKATVKVQLNVVTIRLGSGARMETIGGHIHLDPVGNTEVNVKAEARNIKMGDNSKFKVEGVDTKSAEKNASIHQGAVNVQMGKNAHLEMKGLLPKDVRAVSTSESAHEEDGNTLTLCLDDGEKATFEADTVLSWKGEKKCAKCKSENLCLKLSNNITMFDLNGQHDLQSCVCVCRDCKIRMSTPKEWYTERGFHFFQRNNIQYLIDKDLLYLYDAHFWFLPFREDYEHSCEGCRHSLGWCDNAHREVSAFSSLLASMFQLQGLIKKTHEARQVFIDVIEDTFRESKDQEIDRLVTFSFTDQD